MVASAIEGERQHAAVDLHRPALGSDSLAKDLPVLPSLGALLAAAGKDNGERRDKAASVLPPGELGERGAAALTKSAVSRTLQGISKPPRASLLHQVLSKRQRTAPLSLAVPEHQLSSQNAPNRRIVLPRASARPPHPLSLDRVRRLEPAELFEMATGTRGWSRILL